MAGMAVMAAGSAMQQREQAKNADRIRDAKNDTFEANMIRQRGYAEEAGGKFDENIENQGKDSFDEQKAGEEDKIKSAFNDNRTQPDYNVGLMAGAPKNVVLAREAASGEATAETDRDLNNSAALTSYGGALFNQNMDSNAFARLFGNIRDTASRDANLMGLDMSSAAANASKAPPLFPTLLKAGGQAMSMYGAGAAPGGSGFFNGTVEGALPSSGIGPGTPQVVPGMFTNVKNAFSGGL